MYGSCTANHIYSLHGFESVSWTYSGNSSWSLGEALNNHPPNSMHCGIDYLQSCSPFSVDGRYYRCQNASTCDYNPQNRSVCIAPTQSPSTSRMLFPLLLCCLAFSVTWSDEYIAISTTAFSTTSSYSTTHSTSRPTSMCLLFYSENRMDIRM